MNKAERIICLALAFCICVLPVACTKSETAPLKEQSTPVQEDSSSPQEIVMSRASEPYPLSFSNMYELGNSSRGMRFSEDFKMQDGELVSMSGFMAPPLKPVFNFFVLARQPMAICPFCSSDADWPLDIVVVYVEEGISSVPNDALMTVVGQLELGSYTDPETGFVSQARIYADKIIMER